MKDQLTPKVHTFGSTGQAYDASQCRDDIRDGDVLHIPSEGVTGFLYKAWPVALTVTRGQLHTLAPGFNLAPYAPSVDLAGLVVKLTDGGFGVLFAQLVGLVADLAPSVRDQVGETYTVTLTGRPVTFDTWDDAVAYARQCVAEGTRPPHIFTAPVYAWPAMVRRLPSSWTYEVSGRPTTATIAPDFVSEQDLADAHERSRIRDRNALDAIADILRQPEWSGADDMEAIDALVRATGRDTETEILSCGCLAADVDVIGHRDACKLTPEEVNGDV